MPCMLVCRKPPWQSPKLAIKLSNYHVKRMNKSMEISRSHVRLVHISVVRFRSRHCRLSLLTHPSGAPESEHRPRLNPFGYEG